VWIVTLACGSLRLESKTTRDGQNYLNRSTESTRNICRKHNREKSMQMNRMRCVHVSMLLILILLGGISVVRADLDPALVQQGKGLYLANCVFCHQPDAIGKAGFAPSLTNPELLSLTTDKYFMSTMRDGRFGTGMPPFAHLGRKRLKAILAYLRSFEKLPDRTAEVNDEPPAYGDPRLGQFWFEQICATCHGVKGDGYLAGGTGTAIGKSGFLDKVSDGLLRITIKEGRSNTRMRGFSGPDALANLTDQEIDDIIVYMRTLAAQ